MRIRRRTRWIGALLIVALAVPGAMAARRMLQVRDLEVACQKHEEAGDWTRLLEAARDWVRLEPHRREALRAGALAARELRAARITAEFLERFPREEPEDVPWLSTLVDLQFGPLNQPHTAAETCEDILRLDSRHVRTRQRLIFYYAMTRQHVALLESVEQALQTRSDLPQFHVYAFLADSLLLQNGPAQVQRWMQGRAAGEMLMVAYALHVAHSLEGAVPSVGEEQATALRLARKKRLQHVQQLAARFPSNPEVTAYLLEQALTIGALEQVGNLLSNAPPGADRDDRFWRARGWLFLRLGDLDEAQRSLERAVELHPLDWKARYHQADLLRRQGRLAPAERLHQIATRGRALERDLLAQPDVQSVAPEILQRLAEYADDCGHTLAATRLRSHLRQNGSERPSVRTSGSDGGQIALDRIP